VRLFLIIKIYGIIGRKYRISFAKMLKNLNFLDKIQNKVTKPDMSLCCEKRMKKGRDAKENKQADGAHHQKDTIMIFIREMNDWCCCANAKVTLFLLFVNTLGLAQINPSMQISMELSRSQTIPEAATN